MSTTSSGTGSPVYKVIFAEKFDKKTVQFSKKSVSSEWKSLGANYLSAETEKIE